MAKKILELKNVTFDYGNQRIIEKATFSIEKGDFLGVIGPNGAGKTTLVKLILGLLKPSSGNIRLFGKDLTEFKEWKKVAYIPQKATGFDQNFPATVYEVASMGRFANAGMMKGLSGKDDERIENALEMVGMEKLKNSRIGELSGGQQQRVFMAKALAGEPELLILDEPTVGVDAEAQHNFYSLLKRLNKEYDMALMLISHDVGVISENVNKLLCVNVNVTFHDVSKGLNEAELHCAYPEGLAFVPHHHDE